MIFSILNPNTNTTVYKNFILNTENGKRTWRHGVAPMHYPTHCTAHLISVTGERLTQIGCNGWGDDDPILKDNVYNNPSGMNRLCLRLAVEIVFV